MTTRRRLLIALGAGAVAAPLALFAQQPKKVPRIGYLSASSIEFDKSWLAAFEQGLRDLGYVEGKNVVIERRHSGGQQQKLPELAADLVRFKADVVVTYGGIEAIRKASSTVPIVLTVHSDPVRAGVVATLARPGGQVTGLSDLHGGMGPKRLELLREAVPSVSRVAVLMNPIASTTPLFQLKEIQAAALPLGVSILPLEARGPDDIDRAFATMIKERAGGLITIAEPTVIGAHRVRIADLALKSRIATISTVRAFADAGFLISYGTDFHDLWRRAATYVDKILKGAKPGDLPVEQPTKFELVVNLRTAKALGLTIPQSILVRADGVIE